MKSERKFILIYLERLIKNKLMAIITSYCVLATRNFVATPYFTLEMPVSVCEDFENFCAK